MSLLHPATLTMHTVTDGPPNAAGEVTETTLDRVWGPCNVQAAGTTEARDNGEVVSSRLRASGPLAEWITSADHATYKGHRYRVDGEPVHFTGGALDHTELYLITWRGQ